MLRLRETRRRPWVKWLVVLLLAAALWMTRGWWLQGIGMFLVKAEDPQKADVAVVLAGDGYGHRLMRAVDLVRNGYAPVVLIDGPRGAYGISEADLALAWATSQGVPRDILAPVPMRVRSTVDEVHELNRELERRRVKKALIVTSNYHTRRVRAVLNRFGVPGIQYIVVQAPDEHFSARNWWHFREAKKTVLLEYAKLMNWWLE